MYGEEERRTRGEGDDRKFSAAFFLTERTDNGTVDGLPEAKVWHVLIAHVHARTEWACSRLCAPSALVQQLPHHRWRPSTAHLSSDHDVMRSDQEAK